VVGVSIIGVHVTSRVNTDEPVCAASVRSASRRCHFTVVSLHASFVILFAEIQDLMVPWEC